MVGRPFESYDVAPLRSEANVDPFTNFVNNGMNPGLKMASTGGSPMTANASPSIAPTPAASGPAPSGIMPLLQMLGPILQRMQASKAPAGARMGAPAPAGTGGPAPIGYPGISGGFGIGGTVPNISGTIPNIEGGTNFGQLPGNVIAPLLQMLGITGLGWMA